MPEDPLNWFAHEKVAADDAPTTAFDEDYQIPRVLSKSSLDPGERALAGVAAVSGSLATFVAPLLGRIAVKKHLESGSVKWKAPPIQDVKSIEDALTRGQRGIPKLHAETNILGLFDVKGRPRPVPTGAAPLEAFRQKYVGKLIEVQPVVDSFIDKHNLAQKGVRINIQHGPLTARGGGGFSLANKKVFIPHLGKELALHELGHAADYTGRFGKLRRFGEPIMRKGVLVALPVAIAAGDRIKEMIPGTIDDVAISFMQDHAPEIMGATLAATTLFPEAKASFLAVKHLRELERSGKQPAGTTMKAIRKYAPFWGTYLLGAIPAMVGMSLARKYMRAARAEKAELQGDVEEKLRELEKTGSMADLTSHVKDLAHVAKEIGRGAHKLVSNRGTLRRVARSAKQTGQSPEFIWGAMTAAVPATMGALYMYGTPGGENIRTRLDPKGRDVMLGHRKKQILGAANKDEEWRARNPLRFAGLVAMGAALSGGVMTKFIHDLMKVL